MANLQIYAIFLASSAITTAVEGLRCFACLPSIEGGTISKNLALEMRANISRTWENRKESSFGACSEMNLDERFQVACPDETLNAVCLEINNGFWTARTCGTLSLEANMGCVKSENNIETCYCKSNMCNEAHSNKANSFCLLGASLLLVRTVLG